MIVIFFSCKIKLIFRKRFCTWPRFEIEGFWNFLPQRFPQIAVSWTPLFILYSSQTFSKKRKFCRCTRNDILTNRRLDQCALCAQIAVISWWRIKSKIIGKNGWMLFTRVASLSWRMIVNKWIVVGFLLALLILEFQILRSRPFTQQIHENGRISDLS